MSRSRCAWIWRGSAVGLSRSSGMFTGPPPRLQAILAGFRLSSRANWPDSGRPFPGLERPGKRPGYNDRASNRRPRDLVVEGRQPRGIVMAGEAPIKQAVKWIDDQLQDNPDADRVK